MGGRLFKKWGGAFCRSGGAPFAEGEVALLESKKTTVKKIHVETLERDKVEGEK